MTLSSSPIIPGRRSCVNAGPGWKTRTTHSTGRKHRFIGNGPQYRSKSQKCSTTVKRSGCHYNASGLLHHILHQLPTRDSMLWAFRSTQLLLVYTSGLSNLRLSETALLPRPINSDSVWRNPLTEIQGRDVCVGSNSVNLKPSTSGPLRFPRADTKRTFWIGRSGAIRRNLTAETAAQYA
jgi:hypothetical protein